MTDTYFELNFPFDGKNHRIITFYVSTQKPTPTHGEFRFLVLDDIPGLDKMFVITVDHLPENGVLKIEDDFANQNPLYKQIVTLAENQLTKKA